MFAYQDVFQSTSKYIWKPRHLRTLQEVTQDLGWFLALEQDGTNLLLMPVASPPQSPQVRTGKSCCNGGNPNCQEQETCVNEEARPGNGCSTLHRQTKDTVPQPAASFRLWGLAASGPGTPIVLSVCMHSDQIWNQRQDTHVKYKS